MGVCKMKIFFPIIVLLIMTISVYAINPSNCFLHVEGNQIVDCLNEPVMLTGLAFADPYIYIYDNQHWSEELFQMAAHWGANIVRIPVLPGYRHNYGETNYAQLLDQSVEWAKKWGMYVIIDWHPIGDLINLEFDTNEDPEHVNECTKEETIIFWREMAQRYANEPAVAFFEIMNEPADMGGVPVTWDQWRIVLQEIITNIRVYNTNTIPIVAGLDWAYDLTEVLSNPVTNSGIAYASHPYPENATNEPWSPWEEKWETKWGHVKAQYPVFVTEFGFEPYDGGFEPARGTTNYGRHIIDYCTASNISWTVWCLHPTWQPTLISNWMYAETVSGKFFKSVLTNNSAPKPALIPNQTLFDNFEDTNELSLIWEGYWYASANTNVVNSTNSSWAQPGANGSDAAFRFEYDFNNNDNWGGAVGCDFDSVHNFYDEYSGVRFKMRRASTNESVFLQFTTPLITDWNYFRTPDIAPTANWTTYTYSWSNLMPNWPPPTTNIQAALQTCKGLEFIINTNDAGWIELDDFEFIPRDTAGPVITITVPSGTVSGTAAIRVTNTNGDIVSSVHYQIDRTDGPWIGMTQTETGCWAASPGWNTSTVSDGAHTIYVRAFDYYANMTIINSTVIVSNNPPQPGSTTKAGIGSIETFCIANPVRSGQRVYCTKMPKCFSIAVYNAHGELVYDNAGKNISVSNGNWSEWKCVNNDGETLSSGIYYVKITMADTAGKNSQYRIVKLAVK